MSKHDPFAPDSAIRVAEVDVDGKVLSAPEPKKEEKKKVEPAKEVPPAGTKAPETESGVPHGTVKEVLAWVGDDQDKALAAYDAEVDSDEPRSSLIEALEEKLA